MTYNNDVNDIKTVTMTRLIFSSIVLLTSLTDEGDLKLR